MQSTLSILFVLLTTCHSVAGLNLRWVQYTTKNATVCSHSACRSFVHLVFTASDVNLTTTLVGGARYTLDGGPSQAGRDIHFERHLVHGSSPPE